MFNLNGTQLRITTRYDNVYAYDVEVEKLSNSLNSVNEYQLYRGYSVFILKELIYILNFRYKLCPDIGTFGTLEFNSSTIDQIDLILGSYSLFESRAKILDPTFVTGSSKVVALLNHDFEGSNRYSVFQPFKPELWYSVVEFILIASLASLSLGVLDEEINWTDRLFLVLVAIFQKSSNVQYRRLTCRLIIWIVTITAMILLACYSGTLVSILAIRFFEIRTLDSLLNSQFTILLERGYNNSSPIQSIAETLKDLPLMNKLLEKALKSKFVYESFEKTIETVQNSQSAYVIDQETAAVAIQNRMGGFPCSWSAISVAGIHYPWSMYMKKKSKFKPAINYGYNIQAVPL